MSDALLDKILNAVLSSKLLGPRINFVWHAGEPLVVGRAFFERAFSTTDRLSDQRSARQVHHSVQTNGLLLNDAWLDLFERFQVRVGLSIDGPAFLHDLHRTTRQGSGTHSRVMRAVDLLKARCHPFTVIMVVTRDALDHADAIFDYFLGIGALYVGLNVEELESAHVRSSLAGADIENRLHRFYLRLLQRQEQSARAVRFREFQQYLPLLDRSEDFRAESIFSRSSMVVPLSILNFDANGNFSTFCPELLGCNAPRFNNFMMGNILTSDLDSILENPVFKSTHEEISAGVRRCEQECHYWRFCGGGSPANKFFETGRLDVAQTQYCRQHKQIVLDAVLDHAEACD